MKVRYYLRLGAMYGGAGDTLGGPGHRVIQGPRAEGSRVLKESATVLTLHCRIHSEHTASDQIRQSTKRFPQINTACLVSGSLRSGAQYGGGAQW